MTESKPVELLRDRILRPDMLQFGKQTSTGRVPPCTIASARACQRPEAAAPSRLRPKGQPFQKSLKRSGAISVYLTVC
jgi:hypothetical protein